MTTHASVNDDMPREVGELILEKMVGQSVDGFSFWKSLGTRLSVKVGGEAVKVDPQLIFHRLVAIREKFGDLQSIFKYELCSHPPALFDSSALPLTANKAALADALWKVVENEQVQPITDVQYIIDGGALLHRILWQRGSTYDPVSQHYVRYATRRYGRASVVFGGYTANPSTKDATHLRRGGSSAVVAVHFTGNSGGVKGGLGGLQSPQ